jgi:DNA polymerase-3 subunit delta
MKVREALNDLKAGIVQPVYLLKGGDPFLQSFFIEHVAKTFFGTEPVDKTLMLPDDMTGKEIISQLTISDLFAGKKLFILRNPHQVKGKPGADLLAYCRSPMENHVLILVHDDWTARSSFFTKLETITDLVDVQTPFLQDMKKWANYLFKERGKSVHAGLVDILVNIAGDSVAHLDNEVEKICLLVGDRTRIEAQDIERFTGWRRERQRWEFLLALGGKDYDKAVSLGKSLITTHESMISLIYPLTSMFQEMLFVKMKNGTFREHRGFMPIPPSVKKRIPHFAQGFSQEKLESALHLLGTIDKRQKTAFSTDETELIQFIGHVIG